MKKFLVYKTLDGTYGEELRDTDNEDDVKKWIESQGAVLVRPHAIIGTDEADVISRIKRSDELKHEAITPKSIDSSENVNTKNAIENLKNIPIEPRAEIIAKLMNVSPENAYLASQYAPNASAKYSVTGEIPWKELLFKDAPSILQRFATMENPGNKPEGFIEDVATDPTLIPSFFIPGVGEAKAMQYAGKILPNFLKGGKLEKLLSNIFESGVNSASQTVASETPNIIQGDAPISGLGTRYGVGVGTGLAGKAIGKGLVSGGDKILNASIKAKKGSNIDQTMVSKMMKATMPDSEKKVINAGSSLEKVYNDLENAITEYSKKQAGSLSKEKTHKLHEKIASMIRSLRANAQLELDSRAINELEFDKINNLLDMESDRLMGVSKRSQSLPTPVSELDLHKAKMDYGEKSKYNVTNTFSADPTVRNQYRKLYAGTRNLITDSQLDDMIGAQVEQAPYSKYSTAMAPLMNARDPVGVAVERMGRNQALSLPTYMSAAAGSAAGGMTGNGTTGALLGALLPMIINSPYTGTTAYRLGEKMPMLADKYATPIAVRSINDNK